MTTQGATPRLWRATIRQITGKATCFYGYVATGAKDINRCCHRQHTSAAEAHLCSAREATRRNAHDRLQAEHEKVSDLLDTLTELNKVWDDDSDVCWKGISADQQDFLDTVASVLVDMDREIKAVKEARGEA